MSEYTLHVNVYGPGEDPNKRSHWAFMLARPEDDHGTLWQVLVMDPERMRYQVDSRDAQPVFDRTSEGRFWIANVSGSEKKREVQRVLSEEPAPEGKGKCQDWVGDCIVSLEAEELVPSGTADQVLPLIGASAKVLAAHLEHWELAKGTGNWA